MGSACRAHSKLGFRNEAGLPPKRLASCHMEMARPCGATLRVVRRAVHRAVADNLINE